MSDFKFFDVVTLKDGKDVTIVEVLSSTAFIGEYVDKNGDALPELDKWLPDINVDDVADLKLRAQQSTV